MEYKKYHRDKTYEKFERHFKNIFRKRFDIARNFMKKKGRVLDIGCSTGSMLDIFREAGFETWGVEPSESAEIAREKGHKIKNSYFEKALLPPSYFDVVILNHTLEHMDDAVWVLKKVYRILKANGILVVDVPNAGGLGAKILGNRWPYRLPEEHKYQFTKDSLIEVFEKSGFRVMHFESRSGIFEFAHPFEEVWESLVTLKKRFFRNLINMPYDILVTGLNMGDSMTVIGKKSS